MISPTLTTATPTVAAPVAGTTSTASETASDFETFLKMLTAQARYQDPLEPLDSSEYAAQLAQFSMVEQQVLSNDLLTALTTQLSTGNMAQMTGWIGMEARNTAPISFDGQPVTLYPNPAAAADEVVMVVYDSSGNVVQRNNLPVSADPVQWAGVADDGTPFPNGTYQIAFESRAQDELLISDPAESYTRVVEARIEGGEAILMLQGGTAVLASDVTALREPV